MLLTVTGGNGCFVTSAGARRIAGLMALFSVAHGDGTDSLVVWAHSDGPSSARYTSSTSGRHSHAAERFRQSFNESAPLTTTGSYCNGTTNSLPATSNTCHGLELATSVSDGELRACAT